VETPKHVFEFVQVKIKRYDIKLAGSCDGATVGPSFFVCGTFSPPDVAGCSCTITMGGGANQTVGAFNTGGNNWRSTNFVGLNPGNGQLSATGRINGPGCDGSTDGPYPITVQQGGANTCCVGFTPSALPQLQRKDKSGGMDVSAMAMLITCQHCRNHRMTITTTGENVPDVIVGGSAPKEGLLKVVLVSEKERAELPVKIDKGAWLVPARTLLIGREYTLEALVDGKPAEKLRLRVKAGPVLGSPCKE
jgi:hypothetical protein